MHGQSPGKRKKPEAEAAAAASAFQRKKKARVVGEDSDAEMSDASKASRPLRDIRPVRALPAMTDEVATAEARRLKAATHEIKAYNDMVKQSADKGSVLIGGAMPPNVRIMLFRGWTFNKEQSERRAQYTEGASAPELSREVFERANRAGLHSPGLDKWVRGLIAVEDVPRIDALIREARRKCCALDSKVSPLGYERTELADWHEKFIAQMTAQREAIRSGASRCDFIETPFISFTESPEVAVKYASGWIPTQDFSPIYAKDGSLKHPHIGVVVAALMTPQQIEERGYQFRKMNDSGKVSVHFQFTHDAEVTFLGGLESDFLVHREWVSFPPLNGEYEARFEADYGLSRKDFTEAKRLTSRVDSKTGHKALVDFLLEKLKPCLRERIISNLKHIAYEKGFILARLNTDGTLDTDLEHSLPPVLSSTARVEVKKREAGVLLGKLRLAMKSTPFIERSMLGGMEKKLRLYPRNSLKAQFDALIKDEPYHIVLHAGHGEGLSASLKLLSHALAKEEGRKRWVVVLTDEDFRNAVGPTRKKFGKETKENCEHWLMEMILRHYLGAIPAVSTWVQAVKEALAKKKVIWLLDDVGAMNKYNAFAQSVLTLLFQKEQVVIGTREEAFAVEGYEHVQFDLPQELPYRFMQDYWEQHPYQSRLKLEDFKARFHLISLWLEPFLPYPGALQDAMDIVLKEAKKTFEGVDLARALYKMQWASESPVLLQPDWTQTSSELWVQCQAPGGSDIVWLYPQEYVQKGDVAKAMRWLNRRFDADASKSSELLYLQVKALAYVLQNAETFSAEDIAKWTARLTTGLTKFFEIFIDDSTLSFDDCKIESLSKLLRQSKPVKEAIKIADWLLEKFQEYLSDETQALRISNIFPCLGEVDSAVLLFTEKTMEALLKTEQSPEQRKKIRTHFYGVVLALAKFSLEEIENSRKGLFWLVKEGYLGLGDFHSRAKNLSLKFVLKGFDESSEMMRFYLIAENFKKYQLPESTITRLLEKKYKGVKMIDSDSRVILEVCEALKKMMPQKEYYQKWWSAVAAIVIAEGASDARKQARAMAMEMMGIEPPAPPAAALPFAAAHHGAAAASAAGLGAAAHAT